MNFLIFFICLSTVLISDGYAKQRFDEEPSDAEVNPGDRTVLKCRVQNRMGTCTWLRKGTVVHNIQGKYEYESSPANGDCSFKITDADIKHDDENWQCQVSPITVDQQPLLSRSVHLTVRNKPLEPYIEHNPNNNSNSIQMRNNDPVGTTAGAEMPLSCISPQGNPPATLRWYIDNEEVTAKSHQRNDTDNDKEKTWRAKSTLNYIFQKEHNGKLLKCVATHPLHNYHVIVQLNVRYKPTIRFRESPPADVEENQNLQISCESDANPKATIIWRTPQGNIQTKDALDFRPITRKESGLYVCSANNDVGSSQALEVNLDVKFPPHILSVEPTNSITAQLHEAVRLTCRAEGNPVPRYSWLQSVDGKPNTWQHRGSDSVLNIQNVTYGFQGRYVCEVSNVFGQKEHKEKSFEIGLDVVGPPQILRDSKEQQNVVYEKDEDANINLIFCSDPKPIETYWQWGSSKLMLGESLDRYVAKDFLKDELPVDCYQARLLIKKVESGDSRMYTLYVRNDKGILNQGVELKVQEPVTMSAVIGIVVGCIIVLVLVVLVVYYLLKKEKCLLLGAKGFKPDASENSSRRLSEEVTNGYPQKDRAIPPDALYTDVQDEESPPPQRQGRSDSSIVYADLDLAALQAERQQAKPPRPRDRIEYAEIQFKPSSQRVDV